MKACLDKELFVSGPLKGKCVITKLNTVPISDIESYGYTIITKDYNAFSPYENPVIGSVFGVELFDCTT